MAGTMFIHARQFRQLVIAPDHFTICNRHNDLGVQKIQYPYTWFESDTANSELVVVKASQAQIPTPCISRPAFSCEGTILYLAQCPGAVLHLYVQVLRVAPPCCSPLSRHAAAVPALPRLHTRPARQGGRAPREPVPVAVPRVLRSAVHNPHQVPNPGLEPSLRTPKHEQSVDSASLWLLQHLRFPTPVSNQACTHSDTGSQQITFCSVGFEHAESFMGSKMRVSSSLCKAGNQ